MEYKIITLSKTNCYLLKAQVGYMLIDCGNKSDAYTLLRAVHDLGLTLKDIQYLLLTHHHSDHCGLLPFLLSENPDMRVILSDLCAEHLKTGEHFKSETEKYTSPLLKITVGLYFKMNKSISDTFEPFKARSKDHIISSEDNDTLSKIGIDAKIILTPGHTDDSISVVADDVAFVGDAARNTLNFAGAKYRPLLAYDIDLCNESLLLILNEQVNVICPAHGQPFDAEKLDFLKPKED